MLKEVAENVRRELRLERRWKETRLQREQRVTLEKISAVKFSSSLFYIRLVVCTQKHMFLEPAQFWPATWGITTEKYCFYWLKSQIFILKVPTVHVLFALVWTGCECFLLLLQRKTWHRPNVASHLQGLSSLSTIRNASLKEGKGKAYKKGMHIYKNVNVL